MNPEFPERNGGAQTAPGKDPAQQHPLPEGLTSEEAKKRAEEGKGNRVKKHGGQTIPSIIAKNLFTFFNLIWAIVTVVLIVFGLYKHLTYLLVVIPNILIATVQSIRAKLMVDKLSVANETRASVVRDGNLIEIPAEEIVLGDVIHVDLGRQVMADAVVIDGVAEANESMLTGEADAIRKSRGDRLLSGSYLVSGAVYAEVTAVGKDSYMYKIEQAARNFKAPSSALFRDLNRLIRFIGVVMIPMAILLFFNNYSAYGQDLTAAVEKTSGSIIGMIPAGIYLLVTLTLSLSVVSLGRRRILVQDMYSIEMLASTDTLCLDKTGTITDGTMEVVAVDPLPGFSLSEVERMMAMVQGAEHGGNNTADALAARFGKDVSQIPEKTVPFSSSRKYSAVAFPGGEVYAVGAPHFVPCPVDEATEAAISAYAKEGRRVLLLAKLPDLDSEGTAAALVALSDRIRPNAEATIRRFQDQGVTVRILSGDHAATVSAIAARVGVKNAENYLSCEGLSDAELSEKAEDYAVFGRVTPEQKILLVKTLRASGHIVAMTGDGVNDTLALKESDCAIAMGDGSEMARSVSQIVLLDSDFSALPAVVREGRRCINNVRMSAVLFLMKTVYTVLLSLFSVVFRTAYPFGPNQFLPLEMVVIGMASLLLALEPNDKRVRGEFLKTVLSRSIPNALLMFLPTVTIVLLGKAGQLSAEQTSAIAAFSVTLVGFVNLVFLCIPYTKWRAGVVGISVAALGLVYLLGIAVLHDVMHLLPAVENGGAPLAAALILSGGFAAVIQTVLLLLPKLLEKKNTK